MPHSDLVELTNALLDWQEGAHEVLGDWLEEHGFGRVFHECGGLHRRVGVATALLKIGALAPADLSALNLEPEEILAALENVSAQLPAEWKQPLAEDVL